MLPGALQRLKDRARRPTSGAPDPSSANVADATTSPDNPPLASLRIGKRLFAANLFWQEIPEEVVGKTTRMRLHARNAAQGLEADLYALRPHKGGYQYATGNSPPGTEPGSFSAARALASDVAAVFDAKDCKSWIAVFEAPPLAASASSKETDEVEGEEIQPRFYIIGVTSGSIYPILDFIAEKNEVVDLLGRSILDTDTDTLWDRVFVPGDWYAPLERMGPLPATIDPTPTPTLEALLSAAKLPAATRLVAVRFRPPKMIMAGALLGLLAVGGGLAFKMHLDAAEEARVAAEQEVARVAFIERQRAERERQLEMQRQAQARQTPQATAPETPPAEVPPWAGIPLPTPVLRTCVNAITALPPSYGGWAVSNIVCSRGSLTASLRAAPFVGVSNLLTEQPLAATIPGATDAEIRQAINWPQGDEGELVDQLGVVFAEKLRMIETIRRLNARITFTPIPPPPPPVETSSLPGQAPPPPPPPPPWKSEDFVITTPLTPTVLEHVFKRPGIRITRLSRATANGQASSPATWTINGSLHAR